MDEGPKWKATYITDQKSSVVIEQLLGVGNNYWCGFRALLYKIIDPLREVDERSRPLPSKSSSKYGGHTY